MSDAPTIQSTEARPCSCGATAPHCHISYPIDASWLLRFLTAMTNDCQSRADDKTYHGSRDVAEGQAFAFDMALRTLWSEIEVQSWARHNIDVRSPYPNSLYGKQV